MTLTTAAGARGVTASGGVVTTTGGGSLLVGEWSLLQVGGHC